METIITIDTIADALEETLMAAQQKTLDLVDESQKEPMFDGMRYHAPCDGYLFDDRVYSAGEFLHDPDIGGSAIIKEKIMVDTEVVDELTELFNEYGIHASAGKSWNKNGIEFCYLYIEGAKRFVNTVRDAVPESGKTLVEVEEGVETGTPWDTTAGKLFKKYIDEYSGLPMIPMSESLLSKILNWQLSKKKKTLRLTVGFTYNTYYVGF